MEAPQFGGRSRFLGDRAILQENRKATFPDRSLVSLRRLLSDPAPAETSTRNPRKSGDPVVTAKAADYRVAAFVGIATCVHRPPTATFVGEPVRTRSTRADEFLRFTQR